MTKKPIALLAGLIGIILIIVGLVKRHPPESKGAFANVEHWFESLYQSGSGEFTTIGLTCLIVGALLLIWGIYGFFRRRG